MSGRLLTVQLGLSRTFKLPYIVIAFKRLIANQNSPTIAKDHIPHIHRFIRAKEILALIYGIY